MARIKYVNGGWDYVSISLALRLYSRGKVIKIIILGRR